MLYQYKKRLPKKAKDIVDGIEKIMGKQIEMIRADSETMLQCLGVKEGTFYHSDLQYARVVFYPEVSERSLVHEIIHLERLQLLGVPQIHPKQPSQGKFAKIRDINNDAEHMSVISKESEIIGYVADRWREFYGDGPINHHRSGFLTKNGLYRKWTLGRHLFGDEALTGALARWLEEHNQLNEAEEFAATAISLVSKPPDLLRHFSQDVENLDGDFILQAIDQRTKSYKNFPLRVI